MSSLKSKLDELMSGGFNAPPDILDLDNLIEYRFLPRENGSMRIRKPSGNIYYARGRSITEDEYLEYLKSRTY